MKDTFDPFFPKHKAVSLYRRPVISQWLSGEMMFDYLADQAATPRCAYPDPAIVMSITAPLNKANSAF
ncbi:MAG: hypothetical protein ABW007_08715 [Chitinophagaceae bacterium]